MKRILSLFLILSIFSSIFVLSSCQKPDYTATIESFLISISDGDYAGAYKYLSKEAKEKISEDDFIAKYRNIYEGLQLTSLLYNNLRKNSIASSRDYLCEAIIDSTLIGTLRWEISIPVSYTDKGVEIDWSPSVFVPGMEWGDTIKTSKLAAPRGEIFSADNSLLVENTYMDVVYIESAAITDASAIADKLSPVLGMVKEDLLNILQSPKVQRDDYLILKEYMPGTLPKYIEEGIIGIDGVGINSTNMKATRNYPLYDKGISLSHALGYTGKISAEELEKADTDIYNSDSIIGKSGLEKVFEDDLRGSPGYEVFISREDGTKRKSIYSNKPTPGNDLVLTIKDDVQAQAEELLAKYLKKGMPGVALVMDPTSGAIEAFASYPSYDPRIFLKPIPEDVWSSLNDSESGNPLFNRLTQGLYPPGSVLKPFVAAGAMENGAISTNTVFEGKIVDNFWTPEDNWVWPPIKRAEDSGTPLNLERAMIHSDNIFFAYTAMQMGQESFLALMGKFGFGKPMSFDMFNAVSSVLNEGTNFDRKMLADSGYGQGEILITPLQMASMFCAFENGGSVPRPRILQSVYKTEGNNYSIQRENKPANWLTNVISQDSISTLIPMMHKVCSDPGGTAHSMGLGRYDIWAKTGTAQVGEDKRREISWIIGYINKDGKKKLVMVMLDANEKEGGLKLDIAKKLFLGPITDNGNGEEEAEQPQENKATPKPE